MLTTNIQAESPKALHFLLAQFNASRVAVKTPTIDWEAEEFRNMEFRILEGRFLENLRMEVADLIAGHEGSAEHFVEWFKSLNDNGPGQHHPLFDWLESEASLDEFKWFLTQE